MYAFRGGCLPCYLVIAEEFAWEGGRELGDAKKKKEADGATCILKAHPVVLISNDDITFPRMTIELSQLQGEIVLTSW